MTTDKQTEFENQVAKIFGYNLKNSDATQRHDNGGNLLIYDFWGITELQGSSYYKKDGKETLLIATKDSETNHYESISLEMIKSIVKDYTHLGAKVIFATNIPIDIHSSKAKEFEKNDNFFIQKIGFSFCQKHNLEFTELF